ncbi:HesB/IscA family protein [Alcanivorax sp. S71-1-4]|uniref:HesB/IscA family protein n=1 Tax=Alcanivorax sp. S71-1-4 TaxID=1177159 RepID=UPI0013569E2B|nr:iron-sulfur cluster assembly accessory protein [Alcanivorax sp. S71-1-4]
MSVQTFVPGDARQVSMTATAEQQARREIAREQALGLRLAVKPSGCSGYKYVLEYVQQAEDDDHQVRIADGVVLFVDAKSLPLVKGTEIDYVTEGVNRFFRFRNPNSEGECGCGESFSVTA